MADANTRPESVGTMWSDGDVKYGDVLGSADFPKNKFLPDNCRFCYSDGRWSTRKRRELLFWCEDHQQGGSYPDYVGRRAFVTEFDIQSNVMICCTQGSTPDDYTGTPIAYLLSGNEATIAQEPPQAGRSIQFGMNMTGALELVANYRPIVNWNYNKVAMYPKIVGIYQTAYGFEFDWNGAVDLYDFYRNSTKPTHNEYLCGYTYVGYIVAQDNNYNVTQAGREFNIADEFYIKNTTYTGETIVARMDDLYAINMFGAVPLLGSIPITQRYAQEGFGTWGSVWTGPEDIEGLEVRENMLGAISGGIIDYFPVIPISVLDNNRLTELDLTKIALQCGMPVISNGATMQAFVYDKTPIGDLVVDYPDDLYYPVIDNGRVGTEEYITGEDILESPYYEAGEQGKGTLDPDVTPIVHPELVDTNDYVDTIDLNEPPITPLGKFSHYYMLSDTDITDLVDFLFTSDTTTKNHILEGLQMFGENPMRFIIGLMQFPLDLTQFVGTVESEEIIIGNGVATGITAEKFDTARSILNFGSVKYKRFYGNFLDFAPYTQAKLYLPYCNEIELDTQIFAGKTINVQYIIDWITGNCTAVVKCEEIPVYYVHGQVGVSIGLSGEDKSDYVEQGLSAISRVGSGAMSTISGVAQTATGAGSGNVGAIVGGIGNIVSGGTGIAQGVFDFMHQRTPIETNGTSTSVINFYKPQSAYCILKQSKIYPVQGYEHSVGNACEYSAQLGSLQGWTVCTNVKNITPDRATEKEIAEIKALLESGVYL